MVTVTTNSPVSTNDEIMEKHRQKILSGPAGGNLPDDGCAEGTTVRHVGDVKVRNLDAAGDRMEITDRLGRKLVVKRISELERFDLFEVFGSSTPNAYTVGAATLAATLRSVTTPEGERTLRTFPKTIAHIRGAISLLGDAGMDALRAAYSPPPDPVADEGEGVPNDGSDAMVGLAKN